MEAYNRACEALLSPWRIQNAANQATCSSVTAPFMEKCMEIKAFIVAAGGKLDIGHVKIDADLICNVSGRLENFSVSNDLSLASFNLNALASVPATVSIKINTRTVGKVICPSDKEVPIGETGTASVSDKFVNIKLGVTKGDTDRIMLTLDLTPNVLIQLSPSPINLLDKTALSFIDCPLISQTILGVGGSMHLAKSFQDIFSGESGNPLVNLILQGNYHGESPRRIGLPIVCHPTILFGKKIDYKPLITDTYIGFSD